MSANNSNTDGDIHTQLGEIKGQLKGIDENVYELKKDIRGNGQKGILERLTRTEESLASLVEATNISNSNEVEERKVTTQAISDLTKSIADLQIILTTHVSDKKNHSILMFLNRKDVAIGVGTFVFLHSIFPPLTLQGIANMILQGLGLPVIK
jgi:hypothetical protein